MSLWHITQYILNSAPLPRIKPSLAGDVWSFSTTLWEIFNSGSPPLLGVAPLETALQYLAGDRLPWPGGSGQLAQVLSCHSAITEFSDIMPRGRDRPGCYVMGKSH
jgi:hypothetical protein